jgi:hypothetical protein
MEQLDYRNNTCLSPVRNQGSVLSCTFMYIFRHPNMNLISLSFDWNDLVRKLLGFQFYRSSRVLLLQEIQQDSCYEVITILYKLLQFLYVLYNNRIWILRSEQHLVDCDVYDGGCNGGWYTNAWYYLQTAGGSAKQSLYSYTGVVSANVICFLWLFFFQLINWVLLIHCRKRPLANTPHPC